MKENEKAFLNAAVKMGFLSSEEAKECILAQMEMSRLGLSKPIWEVALNKKFLTQHQVQKISQALRQSRSTAFFPGYRIIKKLGQGGMGTVYQAIQTSLERKVAIKVISPEHLKDRKYLQRISREAKTLARLNHPNIVSAIDFGVHQGVYYLVMEYVDGKALDEEIKKGVVFKEKDALGIALQVTDALEHAHQLNLIHRDIKPANIMIDSQGVAKLCDLGLAKDASLQDKKELTNARAAMGTPAYMSPEQARGEQDIDIRSDIYSLGATLYHLLTGEPPYKAPGVGGIYAQILSEKVPNPRRDNPKLSFSLVRLVRKMMAKDRESRPQDPTELGRLLKATQRGGSYSTVSRIQLSEIESQEGERDFSRLIYGGLGGMALVIFVLLGFVFLGGEKEKDDNGEKSQVATNKKDSKGGPDEQGGRAKPDKGGVASDFSLKEEVKELFGKNLRAANDKGQVVLSYIFHSKGWKNLERDWDRNLRSWKKSGNRFQEQEFLRFLPSYRQLNFLRLYPASFGDIYLALCFKNGKKWNLVWRANRVFLQLREGTRVLEEKRIPARFSPQNPLVVLAKDGYLNIGNPDEIYLRREIPSPLRYFYLIPLMKIKIQSAVLAVEMDQNSVERSRNRLVLKDRLQNKGYRELNSRDGEIQLNSSRRKFSFFIPSQCRAYELDFEFSLTQGKSFQVAFPYSRKLLGWTLRKGSKTGYFPLSRLEALEKYFAPAGQPDQRWHRGKVIVFQGYYIRGIIDGERAFTYDDRYFPYSKEESPSLKEPSFLSQGQVRLRNLRIKVIEK